ncbi:response regulator transcription factor [Nafulsella turpanensis]|uniref:response regulator transcription factor n=1 Tax=Nafulsella turpanensis TaxID=1265690 RepID=UPI00034960E2|nr:response regulator transcription factor [Nafulsella turpanensis]
MGSKQNYKILVVDDEPDILEILQYNLEKEGYGVRVAANGRKGVEEARSFLPDLILLDIMMPEQDGVETCRQIREIPELQNVYVIFLTARAEEYSEIAAFEVGADDYIVKPIKPRALMSRISALFRRESKKKKSSSKISIGDLIIDRNSYTVSIKDQQVVLPKKEFELLYFLAQHPQKVFSRDDLLQNIWGSDVYVLARTVDVHIRKVREKIGEGFITTVKGVGYKFELN